MVNFNIDQIMAFVQVAKLGSFSQAAQVLGRSRSTLHQHITNLEIDLNLTLLNRDKRKLTLTEQGQVIYKQAEFLLYQADYLQNSADNLAQDEEHVVSVFHDSTTPLTTLTEIHSQITAQFPTLELNWYCRERDDIYNALKQGDADLGIVMASKNTLPKQGLDYINLGFFKFSAYARPNSPLVKIGQCTNKDLYKEKHLLLESYLTTNLFDRMKLSARTSIVSNSDLLLSMLKYDGWAVLPEFLVRGHHYEGELAKLDVDFVNTDIRSDYILLSSKLYTAGPILTVVIDTIKSKFKDALD